MEPLGFLWYRWWSQAPLSTVDRERLAHGALHVQPLDIVPVLLEQRHKEVDGHKAVLPQFVRGHAHVAHGHSHAEHLLQLELHLAAHLRHLGLKNVGVLHQRRELPRLVQTRAQQPGDLGDEHLRRQEAVEGLGKLLHELLVLVQLLEVFHTLERHPRFLCLLAMHCVTQDAYLHARPRHVRQLHCAGEPLVALGVVVLEHDLEVYGLQELAWLRLGPLQDLGDTLLEVVDVQLAHGSPNTPCCSTLPVTLLEP
mmetsp:Transcript_111/g.238  ORF Transcript_111/g.238 Transcript_111/m.238 type:complete len:254 (-) Transcript_111:2-763(-)